MQVQRTIISLMACCSLVLQGCATTTTQTRPTIASTKFGPESSNTPAVGTTVLDQAAYTAAHAFLESAKASGSDTDANAKALVAFQAGRALLDHYCNEYLDALGSANQKAANERKQTGLIGGFASSIMGLTGGSSVEIASVASAFSFAQASMDAYTTSYLFSDAASSITKLVRDAQAAYLEAIEAQTATLDYPGAVSLLGGYEQICRPAQIRGLIDQAIAAARIVTEAPGARFQSESISSLLTELTSALGKTVREGDAIALYAWYISNDTDRSKVINKSAFVQSMTADDASRASLQNKLSSSFLPLMLEGNAISKKWGPTVQKWFSTDVARTAAVQAPKPLLVIPSPRVKQ